MIQPLPANTEAEKAVLACVLMDGNGPTETACEMGVTPDAFTDTNYRLIFGAVLDLYAQGVTVDVTTCANQLVSKKLLNNTLSISLLSEIAMSAGTTAKLSFFLGKINECYVARRTILYAQQLIETALCYKGNNEGGILSEISNDLSRLNNVAEPPAKEKPWSAVADEAKAITAKRRVRDPAQAAKEIHFPWPALHELFGPIEPGELVTIAARPSVGKSSFARLLAWAQVIRKKHVLCHSLEVTETEFATNLAANISGLPSRRPEQLSENDYQHLLKAYDEMKKYEKYLVVNTSDSSLAAMLAKASTCIKRLGTRVWIIDYLGLIPDCNKTNKGENLAQSIGRITAALKRFAATHEIAVIQLAQLNREIEKRSGPPLLSDLRDSGAIEQDSSRVIFLHRPSEYVQNGVRFEQDKYATTEEQPSHYIEVIQAKQRNGAVCGSALKFIRQTATFTSYDNQS